MKGNIFCIVPWVHLAMDPNGDYKSCCVATYRNFGYNASKSEIMEVFNSPLFREVRLEFINGEWPDNCIKCKMKEDLNISSTRTRWSSFIKKGTIEYLINHTKEDGSTELQPSFFDIKLGNKCNLACRMCDPDSSTGWYKHYLECFETNTIERNGQIIYQANRSISPCEWYENNNFWDELDQIIDKKPYVSLHILGGEPFIIEEHKKFMNRYAGSERAKKMQLGYHSNLTVLDEEFFEQWKTFKKIRLRCSIDGVGKVNDYQRWPSNWNTILKNLRRLHKYCDENENIECNIYCAVTINNVYFIPDLIFYFLQDEFFHFREKNPFQIVMINLAFFPKWLVINILPEELKTIVKQKYEKWIKKFESTIENPTLRENTIKNLNDILNVMFNKKNNDNSLKEFKRVTLKLDELRGQSFEDINPQFKKLLD